MGIFRDFPTLNNWKSKKKKMVSTTQISIITDIHDAELMTFFIFHIVYYIFVFLIVVVISQCSHLTNALERN